MKVYRWDDASAPVLTLDVHSFCLVMKAVLDTGYGSESGAGWETVWEDAVNGIIVFRNSIAEGGSGCYLRVKHGAADPFNASLEVFEDMTDIDTGIGPCQTDPYYVMVYARTSPAVPAGPLLWRIYASEKTVYGSTVGDDNAPATNTSFNGYTMFGAGDFESFHGGAQWQPFCSGREEAAPPGIVNVHARVSLIRNAPTNLTQSFASNTLSTSRNYAGSPGVTQMVIMWAGGTPGSTSLNSFVPTYFDVVIKEYGAVRGRLHNLYIPSGSEYTTTPTTWETIIDGYYVNMAAWSNNSNNKAALVFIPPS